MSVDQIVEVVDPLAVSGPGAANTIGTAVARRSVTSVVTGPQPNASVKARMESRL